MVFSSLQVCVLSLCYCKHNLGLAGYREHRSIQFAVLQAQEQGAGTIHSGEELLADDTVVGPLIRDPQELP